MAHRFSYWILRRRYGEWRLFNMYRFATHDEERFSCHVGPSSLTVTEALKLVGN